MVDPVGTLVRVLFGEPVNRLGLCRIAFRFADRRSVLAQLAMFRPTAWLARALPRRVGQPMFDKVVALRTKNRGLEQWIIDEIGRGDLRLVVEAGTALRHFDSRGWATAIGVPVSVVVVDHDTVLPTRLQNELVSSLREPHTFHIAGDHDVCVREPEAFTFTT